MAFHNRIVAGLQADSNRYVRVKEKVVRLVAKRDKLNQEIKVAMGEKAGLESYVKAQEDYALKAQEIINEHESNQ